MSPKRWFEQLPVKLNQQELIDVATSQARMCRDLAALRAEERQVKAQLKLIPDEIAQLEAELEPLSQEYLSGKRVTEVEVEDQPDWNTKTVRVLRLDTREFISGRERPMTAQERQGRLFDAPTLRDGKSAAANDDTPRGAAVDDVPRCAHPGCQQPRFYPFDYCEEHAKRCAECGVKGGHKSTCSQHAANSGTPIETEYEQAELEKMADAYCLDSIKLGDGARIYHVQGAPHVIVGTELERYPAYGEKGVIRHVIAHAVLPLENVGEDKAHDYSAERAFVGTKINTGTRRKPDWWVIVGERMIFTRKPEASTESVAEVSPAPQVEPFYCPEHDYTPPPNSGFAFCPQCEMREADTPVRPIEDTFTAEQCSICQRIDGAHDEDCENHPEYVAPQPKPRRAKKAKEATL